MIQWITSKDYLYIKVRYHASDYLLKKDNWQDNPNARNEQWNAAKLYSEFRNNFVTEFSGHPYSYFQREYMFGATEAAEETLREVTGVSICCAEGHYIYCIPKTRQDIYVWILDNCKCKHKVIKKTRGTYMNREVSTSERDYFRSTNENIKKYF